MTVVIQWVRYLCGNSWHSQEKWDCKDSQYHTKPNRHFLHILYSCLSTNMLSTHCNVPINPKLTHSHPLLYPHRHAIMLPCFAMDGQHRTTLCCCHNLSSFCQGLVWLWTFHKWKSSVGLAKCQVFFCPKRRPKFMICYELLNHFLEAATQNISLVSCCKSDYVYLKWCGQSPFFFREVCCSVMLVTKDTICNAMCLLFKLCL